MADIVQLQDRRNGTDQFPVTLTEAVIDTDGNKLSALLPDLAHVGHTHSQIAPIATRDYTGTTFWGHTPNATTASTTYLNNSWFFISLKPQSANTLWSIKYRIQTTIPDHPGYCTESIVEYFGIGTTLKSYKIWNTIGTGSAAYYNCVHWLNATGLSAGFGHAIGISIRNGSNYNSSGWYRHFHLDLLDVQGADATVLDAPVIFSSWNGGNTTNYATASTPSTYNATSQGLQETGDADTTTTLLTSAASIGVGGFPSPGYCLCAFNEEGDIIGISNDGSTSNSTSLSRQFPTQGLDYRRGLFYRNSDTFLAADATPTSIALRKAGSGLDFRYTDNCVASTSTTQLTLGLRQFKDIYIRGKLDEKGLFHVAPLEVTYSGAIYERAWTQDVPTEPDGYVYWLVGRPYYNSSYANNLYQYDLFAENPLFYHDGVRFREYLPPTVSPAVRAIQVGHTIVLQSNVKLPEDTPLAFARRGTWTGHYNGHNYHKHGWRFMHQFEHGTERYHITLSQFTEDKYHVMFDDEYCTPALLLGLFTSMEEDDGLLIRNGNHSRRMFALDNVYGNAFPSIVTIHCGFGLFDNTLLVPFRIRLSNEGMCDGEPLEDWLDKAVFVPG